MFKIKKKKIKVSAKLLTLQHVRLFKWKICCFIWETTSVWSWHPEQ